MGRRPKKKGRDISGILVLDKPLGASSNSVLQQVKRLFNANKAGHTGSLDPLASGVLPICLGEATKLSNYLLDADKQYEVTGQLGVVTETGDVEGQMISTHAVPEFDEVKLCTILAEFIGQQQQVPPMFSALKHQGQPLYKLARQGVEVERKSRTITIYSIDLLASTPDSFTLTVRCSKGTYIRTLVEDISYRLGTGGHVTYLRRTSAAQYQLEQAVTLSQLEDLSESGLTALDNTLHAPADALPDWPAIHLNEDDAKQLRFGQHVYAAQTFTSENVRLFDHENKFFGLGTMDLSGLVKPKRLFVQAEK